MRCATRTERLWLACGLLLISSVVGAGQLPGTLDWGDRIELGTLVSGVIEKVGVQVGQRVKKGRLLVGLDGRLFDARLAEARAAFDYAKSQLSDARREDKRSAEPYDRTLLPDHERNLAAIALQGAESAMARAHANLVQAQLNRTYSRLRSPVDGVVLALHAVPGQAVLNRLHSQVLVELASDGQMRLQLQAGAATADAIARSRERAVEVAGRHLSVTRLLVGLQPVARNQAGPLYRVSAYFNPPAGLALRAGEAARLSWSP